MKHELLTRQYLFGRCVCHFVSSIGNKGQAKKSKSCSRVPAQHIFLFVGNLLLKLFMVPSRRAAKMIHKILIANNIKCHNVCFKKIWESILVMNVTLIWKD